MFLIASFRSLGGWVHTTLLSLLRFFSHALVLAFRLLHVLPPPSLLGLGENLLLPSQYLMHGQVFLFWLIWLYQSHD
jgi:hypothetical protein